MSDLPDLGRPRRPGSPPRPEVLAAIVATGRQRLRRAALGGAGAMVTVVAMVLGTGLLGGGGSDALVVVPASPFVDVTASPAPRPETPQPESSTPADPEVTAPLPSSRARPAGSAPLRGTAGDVEHGDAPPRVDAEPGRPLPEHREQPDRRGSYGDLCRGSTARWAPEGYRLCMAVRMSTSVPRSTPVSIELELCSSLSSPGSLRLSFRSGREHEVQVRAADAADDHAWTWSRHHRFPQGPHDLSLARGECLTWKTTWDTRDDAGELLPPGDYVVEAAVDAEGATQWVQQPFQVTADPS